MAGEIKWLRIWWNNSNPRLVAKFYFDAVRELGGAHTHCYLFLLSILVVSRMTIGCILAIPLVTQSDAGTENFGIANAHTTIRHRLDPTLADTLQHRWMGKLMNIKPEIAWSMLNRDWKPGFEAILDHGVDEGWYDPNNALERFAATYICIHALLK